MKTKKLIELLQREDPEGTCDVSVNNLPIIDIYKLPYYYDGRLQFVEQGANGKYLRAGWKTDCNKIIIDYTSVKDILLEDPELPIETSGASSIDNIETLVNEWRQAGRKMQVWGKDLDDQHKHEKEIKK